jgi:hypothetical protein
VRPSPNAKPDIFDTLAALLPSNSDSSATQLPSSSSLPAASTQTPLISGSDHWVIVERKMQSLGVSRYTIEGEPGTRVVFSCLIPLAGRQAIAQRFEAEGDDMVQAALAALRRITLWQAIQPTSRWNGISHDKGNVNGDFWYALANFAELENRKELIAQIGVNYNTSRIVRIKRPIKGRGQQQFQVRLLA